MGVTGVHMLTRRWACIHPRKCSKRKQWHPNYSIKLCLVPVTGSSQVDGLSPTSPTMKYTPVGPEHLTYPIKKQKAIRTAYDTLYQHFKSYSIVTKLPKTKKKKKTILFTKLFLGCGVSTEPIIDFSYCNTCLSKSPPPLPTCRTIGVLSLGVK